MKTNTRIHQQIFKLFLNFFRKIFSGKLEEDGGATMFFIAEEQLKTILNFSLDSLIVKE